MKFKDMKYERLDSEKIISLLKCENEILKNASSFKDANNSFLNIINTINLVDTMQTLSMIGFVSNTSDEFYKNEMEFMDELLPTINNEISSIYKTILSSKFIEDFKKEYGDHLIEIYDFETKLINNETLDLMVEENKLTSKYTNLLSSAIIEFNGEKYPLPLMSPFLNSKDRNVRKSANIAFYSFFEEKRSEFESIFSSLVEIRHKIAKILNFKSYTDYSYINLKRYDYNKNDIESLRNSVKKYIVPLVSKYSDIRKERLGLDEVYYYDEAIEFQEGSINPILSYDEMIESATKMYSSLSPSTKEFFDFMRENELMDLLSRENKSPGGFCDLIRNYKAPYIFANFNGTSDDVDVLTHEAGHAFFAYVNRDLLITDYINGGFDLAEIHSMSMEFLTYPYMNLFFGENEKKYKYNHVLNALKFIPYGLLVDEFQEKIYENVNLTPKERNELWISLEKEYIPHRNYDNNKSLEEGIFWFKQSHIFKNPFYYVDYVLAQITAFQFYNLMNVNHSDAFKKYEDLVNLGMKFPFKKTLKMSNLESPFDENLVKKIAKIVEETLVLPK